MNEIENLLEIILSSGFQDAGFITTHRLASILNNTPVLDRAYQRYIVSRLRSWYGTDIFLPEKPSIFLVCALSTYRDEEDDPQPGDKKTVYGLVAPFARRNFYRESVARLKKIAVTVRSLFGIKRDETRIFCNSGCPEKFLAWASGIGFYGKNSLIISKVLGSSFVISGMILPWPGSLPLPPPHRIPPDSSCGACRACIRSCPAGAIGEGGGIDEARCIQALSTKLITMSEPLKKAFGFMIYGCKICQDACPYNQHLSFQTQTAMGDVGPAIPLHELLHRSPHELKDYLKKTVLDSSWIRCEALQRNALIVSGNRKQPVILEAINPFLESVNPFLREAAEWAVNRIG
ncbi:MAG: hypothetical protein JW881_02175 [Spirochaetales bacterium]|nr:hypothetical protein [Spirochaetales bacterium]